MFFYIFLALLSTLLYMVLNSYLSLRRNIAQAKASGLPYIVLPFSELGVTWSAVVQNILIPLIKLFPGSQGWIFLRFLDANHNWKWLREGGADYIGDIYLTVSPSTIHCVSTLAEANAQICARRTEFTKPCEEYTIVNHFGRNVLTSEGSDWRRQRKIVAPAFSEKNNATVWEQSLRQVRSMLKFWAARKGNDEGELKIEDTAPDTQTLALHVISGAGFGVPQLWPGEDEGVLGEGKMDGFNTRNLMRGHTLDFKTSLKRTVGIEIVWLNFVPHWILRRSPFEVHNRLMTAYDECRHYFKELFDHKRQIKEAKIVEDGEGTMDLMGPLIKASNDAERASHSASSESGKSEIVVGLNEEEIVGNSFIFLFAGHETTSNILHFSFLFLAMHPSIQAHLQLDIDSIVGSRPILGWSYATDMRNIYNSMVGAVLHETLRLMPPVILIPKANRGGTKELTLDGKTIIIPPKTYFHLDVVGTARNPRYYPHSPSKITGKATDMDDFVPARWLLSDKANVSAAQEAKTKNQETVTDGLENASFEMSGSLFRPVKGAFMPFSEGARACPGRRFAQVEITAVLAVIFKLYTVELDVRAWASDEMVERMTNEEKRSVYGKAWRRAHGLIRGSISTISLKMEGEPCPLRFVKRGGGGEMFGGLNL